MTRPKEFLEISGFPDYKINREGIIKLKKEKVIPSVWKGSNKEELDENARYFVILSDGRKKQSFFIDDLVKKTFGE